MSGSVWLETEESPEPAPESVAPWPLRPVLLGALGAVTGIGAHWLLGSAIGDFTAVRASLLMALLVGAALIGFTLERRLWWAAIAFSLMVGAVAGLVTWWNGAPGGWSAGEGWRMVSLALSVAIAAPLFQAARDAGALRLPYASVHDHAWTNVVLWCACWAFVAVVFALAWLLAALFSLIKIDVLRDLLVKEWFWRLLIGAAFGTGLGVLRENDRVVRLLQRVVATVLAVLAPVLAAGLALFLLALPFTGLSALWKATSAATPVLLSCAVGALILANAVIGNAADEEKRFAPLRFGAMVLAAAILPLAVIAAISTGLRIGQYGYTPERLWAVVFVTLACLYGAAYWIALVRGRLSWAARVRPANLALACATCAAALVLATPLVGFNAISTRDQVARLESGKVSAEDFDWRALAFDFGAPGREALKKFQQSRNAAIRERAAQAAQADTRWQVDAETPSRATAAKRIRVLPAGLPPLPDALLDRLAKSGCGAREQGGCTVLLVAPDHAIVLRDSCFSDRSLCTSHWELRLSEGEWSESGAMMVTVREDPGYAARAEAQHKAYAAGQIDVRPVQRRQVFVGGQPVGEAFE